MNKCFVIQPFDGGKYDKRYKATFKPAIKQAGLEPYRVDHDPSVSIPILEIEEGIRSAEICFAEISTDNPNVWFELGYALALRKNVAMVSSDERKAQYPFDIRHHNIIKYNTEAPQDYDDLRKKITKHLEAVITKNKELGYAASISPVQKSDGLQPHELTALVSIMQNSFHANGHTPRFNIHEDMSNAGFNKLAVALSLKQLINKGLIKCEEWREGNDDYHSEFYQVTEQGESWLLANQNQLILKRQDELLPPIDESIPF